MHTNHVKMLFYFVDFYKLCQSFVLDLTKTIQRKKSDIWQYTKPKYTASYRYWYQQYGPCIYLVSDLYRTPQLSTNACPTFQISICLNVRQPSPVHFPVMLHKNPQQTPWRLILWDKMWKGFAQWWLFLPECVKSICMFLCYFICKSVSAKWSRVVVLEKLRLVSSHIHRVSDVLALRYPHINLLGWVSLEPIPRLALHLPCTAVRLDQTHMTELSSSHWVTQEGIHTCKCGGGALQTDARKTAALIISDV